MAWHALMGALVLEHAGLTRAEPPGATVPPNGPERHFAPTDPACTHYGKCLSGTVPLRTDEDAAKRVRVLCHVLCAKKRRASCIAQHRTWGQHCDRIVFSSDFDDAAIGAVDVKPRWEGAAKKGASRDKWARGWLRVLAHHAEEYDWFVKADDDTLVLVENLRRYAAATASALQVLPHLLRGGLLCRGKGVDAMTWEWHPVNSNETTAKAMALKAQIAAQVKRGPVVEPHPARSNALALM